jgi:hypothetical protein
MTQLERRADPTHPLTRGFALVGIMLCVSAVSLVAMVVAMVRLNALVQDNRRSSAYIIECTTPGPAPPPDTGHRCFDAGQARTGAAIRQIIDALTTATTSR